MSGGTPSVLAHGHVIGNVATDRTDIYRFDTHQNARSYAPIGGGAATVIAKDVAAEIGPVVDDAAIYWVSMQNEVMRLPKSSK